MRALARRETRRDLMSLRPGHTQSALIGVAAHNQAHNETIERESLREDQNQDHADEEPTCVRNECKVTPQIDSDMSGAGADTPRTTRASAMGALRRNDTKLEDSPPKSQIKIVITVRLCIHSNSVVPNNSDGVSRCQRRETHGQAAAQQRIPMKFFDRVQTFW